MNYSYVGRLGYGPFVAPAQTEKAAPAVPPAQTEKAAPAIPPAQTEKEIQETRWKTWAATKVSKDSEDTVLVVWNRTLSKYSGSFRQSPDNFIKNTLWSDPVGLAVEEREVESFLLAVDKGSFGQLPGNEKFYQRMFDVFTTLQADRGTLAIAFDILKGFKFEETRFKETLAAAMLLAIQHQDDLAFSNIDLTAIFFAPKRTGPGKYAQPSREIYEEIKATRKKVAALEKGVSKLRSFIRAASNAVNLGPGRRELGKLQDELEKAGISLDQQIDKYALQPVVIKMRGIEKIAREMLSQREHVIAKLNRVSLGKERIPFMPKKPLKHQSVMLAIESQKKQQEETAPLCQDELNELEGILSARSFQKKELYESKEPPSATTAQKQVANLTSIKETYIKRFL